MKKMQIQIIILAAVIVIGGLYLFFSSGDNMYKLPEYDLLNTDEITKITVENSEGTKTFKKSGDTWIIIPEEYEMDKNITQNILNTISELTLTELISKNEQFTRYGLDEESKTTVTAYTGDNAVRKFYYGKQSTSYQHTFLMRENDNYIYQARGDFADTFEKETDALRDKTALMFDTEDILILTVKMADGTEIKLNKVLVPGEQTETAESPQPEPEDVVQWQTPDGVEFKSAEIENMLSGLSNLKCTGYVEEGFQLPEQLFTLTLKGSTEYKLTVYNKTGDNYPGESSMNNYVFLLPSWQIENAAGIFAPPEETAE